MMWLLNLLLATALATSVTGYGQPVQEQPQSAENYEFFSGTIEEMPEGKITVARSVLGSAPETRSFIVTPETKIEGKLKVKVRVTVGFKPSENGDVAVRIIVRNQQKK
jgi:hypothetical protein